MNELVIDEKVISDLETIDQAPEEKKFGIIAKALTAFGASVRGLKDNFDERIDALSKSMSEKSDDDGDGDDYTDDDEDAGGDADTTDDEGDEKLNKSLTDGPEYGMDITDFRKMLRGEVQRNNAAILKSFTIAMEKSVLPLQKSLADLEEVNIKLHTDLSERDDLIKSIGDRMGQRPTADTRRSGGYRTIEAQPQAGAVLGKSTKQGKDLLMKAMMAGRIDNHTCVALQYELTSGNPWSDKMEKLTEGLQ